ncbi:MAG: methyltransferase domain-containing protein [Alphaproteobacteria bacterium]
MTENLSRAIAAHYGGDNIEADILAALARAGVDVGALSPRLLATADQLHPLGPVATDFQAGLVAVGRDALALDLGCGIGGPARTLAQRWGCRVVGVDLSVPYLRAAVGLTARCGLADSIWFCAADGIRLPFADDAFDLAWCQNVAINIPDKAALYGEIHRVLAPGSAFAFTEIVAGAGEPDYPLPWARDAGLSFLEGAEDMRGQLEDAGFRIESWFDNSAEIIRAAQLARDKKRRPGPTVAIAFGADIGQRVANMTSGLAKGTLGNIVAVARKE